ncbi:MAG: hypothetical protein Q8893_01165 [Candidatus Phytoplasma australasiaticum]|nr:hypothetical protein [Candidatus Phytoplasma australasiaticum]
MYVQTKNKILTIFTIIICAFLTIGGIRALHNYFSQQKKETIKLNNGVNYDDTKRLPMVLTSDDGHLDIQIKLEQKQFINHKDPFLNLIIDYELVDQDGNAWSGGSQTIANKIIQTA